MKKAIALVWALLLIAACSEEPRVYALGYCIEPEDGYDTCDDFCAERYGTRAFPPDPILGEEAVGHACEVRFGPDGSPAVGPSAAYMTLDACESDTGSATSIVYDGEGSPFLGVSTYPDPAAKCCCVAY